LPKAKERQYLTSVTAGGPILHDHVFFFGSYEGLRLRQPRTQVVSVATPELRAQVTPALRQYLAAAPLPNGKTIQDGVAAFAATYADPSSFDVSALRLDANASSSLTGFIRMSHAPSSSATRRESLSTISRVSVRNESVTGGVTWIMGQDTTVDLRAN